MHHLDPAARKSDKERHEMLKTAVPGLTLFEIWEADERDGQIVRLGMEDINQQIDDAAHERKNRGDTQARRSYDK